MTELETEKKKITVQHRGRTYKVKLKRGILILHLSGKNINDISEIKGLDEIMYLQFLNLENNRITEIKSSNKLVNWQV